MREREVAILTAQGLVNSEIADRLGIGAATVKTHVSTLPEKFQVRNRAQLAVAAADRLTPPPEPGPVRRRARIGLIAPCWYIPAAAPGDR